jgi:putative nucleotidyltransferase with HDIG domain
MFHAKSRTKFPSIVYNKGRERDVDKQRWKDWLGQGHFGKRLFVAFLFFLSLAFFLHFRQVRMESLELNTVAERYIIGQVDFSFPDEEATALLRQQAAGDVGKIYRLGEKELHQVRAEFERSLLTSGQWREQLETVTFDQLYHSIDALEEALLFVRFTTPRTLQKMRDFHLSTENYFLVPLPKGEERVALPKKFWQQMQEKVFSAAHFNPEAVSFVENVFASHAWKFDEDFAAERSVRQVIQEKVPQQYTLVTAGAHIIDPGEQVTPRHLAMLQAMKDALAKERNPFAPRTIAGSLILSFLFTTLSICYFRIYHRQVLDSLQKMVLLISIVILTLILSKIAEYFLVSKTTYLIDIFRYPIIVPFAAILIFLLVSSDVALFAAAFLTIVIGVTLAIDHDRFLVINLIASWVTILFARSIHKRKEIFTVLGKVWLTCIPVIIAFNLSQNVFILEHLIQDLISSFLFISLISLLVIGLLPLLESLFHVMTDMTLMEYMDPNNELLRRLSVEAPGTYQHCLVVGSLAENAARAIGAAGLFCRVATLYHDIGKLLNPHYFTENQLGGFNIHQLLTPIESSQVIIAHVHEGENLARKYHLPQSFIDIITQHHGTTLVYYFYSKQLEQVGGDATKVDEKLFRYPGPKPHTKESAIIMLADTVEAASRSLETMNEEAVREMVETLIAEKVDDGQLDGCQLTFEELEIVKKSLVRTLVVTGHLRIKYPERKTR